MLIRVLFFRFAVIAAVFYGPFVGVGNAQSTHSAPVLRAEYLLDGRMLLRTPETMQLMEEGRLAIIDFRLPDAERAFTRLANAPDGRPAGLYHLTTVSFFRFLMSDSEMDRADFELRSDELKAELDNHSESPWRALFGAEVNLQRAIVRAKTGKYVRAALAARTAYFEFERIVREYPTFYDGQKGYGLLKLGIGSMPSTYRRFLSILGFGGSIDEGLQALSIAGAKGHYSREEALALSSLASVVLLEPEDGLDGLDRLQTQYPESALFEHLYGYVLFENRRMEEAAVFFRSVVQRESDRSYFDIDYARYFLGISLFRLNRFEEAEDHLSQYVTKHAGDALDAPALLFLGMSIEMQGRRHEATKYYERVRANREFDLDVVSKRRSELLLSQPIIGIVRDLQLGANSYDAARYDEALTFLSPIASGKTNGAEHRAEAYYRIGRVHHAKKNHDDALIAYKAAILIRGDVLSRWAPWSEYYSGRILEERGNVDQARSAYARALSYTEKFDYYQALENNAKIGIQRLK